MAGELRDPPRMLYLRGHRTRSFGFSELLGRAEQTPPGLESDWVWWGLGGSLLGVLGDSREGGGLVVCVALSTS